MKEGYKLTELGEIPEDWELKIFQDVMTGFFSGQTPSRAKPEYYKGDIRWITSGELNYNVITDTIEKITSEAVRRTNLKILPKGTFLIAITGLEAEGTRGSCGIVGEEATTNQSCMALFPKKSLSNEYLYHFYVRYGNWLAFKYCQGTKQQSYTGKIARLLPIIVPPTIAEQKAIATALSDIDALIIRVEELIGKQKKIKQGALQKLMTPKKGWTKKKIGDIADIIGGGTPSTSIPHYWNGSINWFTPTEIGSKKFVSSSRRKITKEGYSNSSAKLLPAGSILLTSRAGIGDVAILTEPSCTNQGFQSLVVYKDFDNEFIYYLVSTLKSTLIQNASGSTFLEISPKKLKSIEVLIPCEKEDQEKIAQVLSDMDMNIEALEAKLNKYRLLKQGMMQTLLTGNKRLTLNNE